MFMQVGDLMLLSGVSFWMRHATVVTAKIDRIDDLGHQPWQPWMFNLYLHFVAVDREVLRKEARLAKIRE